MLSFESMTELAIPLRPILVLGFKGIVFVYG